MLEMLHEQSVRTCSSEVCFETGEPLIGGAWGRLAHDEDKITSGVVTHEFALPTLNDFTDEASWRCAHVNAGTPERVVKQLGRYSGYSKHVVNIGCIAFATAYGPLVISVETTRADGFGDTPKTRTACLALALREVAGARILGQVDFWTWLLTHLRYLFLVAGPASALVGLRFLVRSWPSISAWFRSVLSAGHELRDVGRHKLIEDCLPVVKAVSGLQQHHAVELGHAGSAISERLRSLCEAARPSSHTLEITYFSLHALMLLILRAFRPSPNEIAKPHTEDKLAEIAATQTRRLVGHWRVATEWLFAFYLTAAVAAAFRFTEGYPYLVAAADVMNLLSSRSLLRVYFSLTRSVDRKFGDVPEIVSILEWIIGIFVGLSVLCSASDFAGAYGAFAALSSVLIGAYGCIALGLLVGRLNSPVLGTPGLVVACLFVYVAVQPLYPVLFDDRYVLMFNIATASLTVVLFLVVLWAVNGNAVLRYLLITGQSERTAPQVSIGKAFRRFWSTRRTHPKQMELVTSSTDQN